MLLSGFPKSMVCVSFAAALTLSACGGVPFMGDDDKKNDTAPVTGKREAVMVLEDKLEIDPSLAATQIALPPPYENAEWPQPGGYPANAMHHLALPANLKKAWSAKAGAGSDERSRLIASPVVGGGKVFVRDAHAGVFAFDEATGHKLWSVDVTPDEKKVKSYEGTGGGVAYADGKVVASSGFGFAYAFDANTGAEIWRQDLGADVRTAPTISNGRVFVSTFDNQLYALDLATGALLWSHRSFQEVARMMVATSPAVENDIVIAPYSSGELYAIDAISGHEAWSDSLSRTGRLTPLSAINDIAGRPVIDRGIVFAISHAGRIAAIDARLGQRLWTHNIGGTQTPWAAGDWVYVITDDAQLICFQRETGKIAWIQHLQPFKNMEKRENPVTWSGPVLGSDRLIVLSSEGDALALSPYTGEKLGRIDMPNGTLIPPIISNQMVFVLTDNAELIAYK